MEQVKSDMEIDHKNIYKLYMKTVNMSTIKNMTVVQNFEVITDKLNIVKMCSNVNYA
jgi:hypothetical protein